MYVCMYVCMYACMYVCIMFLSQRRKVHPTVTTVTHNVDNDEEDEFSLQLHELAMQTKMRKREQDIDFLKKRMRYTFQQRKE